MVAPILKAVAKTAGVAIAKTSRAKKKSDEIYNARRRYKRQLARESKKQNPDKEKIASLQEKISQSYATKQGEYLIDIESFVKESIYVKESYRREYIKRKNETFKREINQASSGGVSSLTKEETKIFYAATQKFWQGKPQGKWNKAIMEHFGVDTLEEAWNLVFSDERVKEALREAQRNQKPIGSEEDIAQGLGDEREDKGSPPYIKGLILTMDM